MKKIISITSIILAICLMVSCGNVNETVTSSTDVIEITTETTNATGITIATTEITTESSTQNSATLITTAPSAEHPLLTNEDYLLYQKFLNSTDLPKDFIVYDQISDIGEFVNFVCLTDAYTGDYSQYVYFVKDENNFKLSVYVEKTEDTISTENILMNEKPTDYRKVSVPERGILVVNGAKYVYVKGQLFSIDIQYGNLRITIDGNLMDYPTNGADTFISRLLSPETAGAAIEQFEASLKAADNTTQSTIPAQTTETTVQTTGSVVSGGEHATVTIEDYKEYVSFVSSKGLGDDFITYDELSFLGSFKAFICPLFASAKELKQYIYDFKDSNGYDIAIAIQPVRNQVSTENILTLNNIADYRKLSSDEKGVATINGLTYSYVKGNLLTIEFVYENMHFVISGNSVLSDYPTNGTDTFMSRLLSPATAKAAAAELVTALAK